MKGIVVLWLHSGSGTSDERVELRRANKEGKKGKYNNTSSLSCILVAKGRG